MKLPKRLSRNAIYESNWISVYTDKVEMPTGRIIEKYHQLVYPFESVVVLPVNEKKEVCMVQSLRYATQRVEWELPAGRIDEGEDIELTAAREFKEETGFVLNNPKWIQGYNPSNGMSNEVLHIVTGQVDSMEQGHFDLDEVGSVHWKNKDEVRKMIQEKQINDGISLIPLLMWLADLV